MEFIIIIGLKYDVFIVLKEIFVFIVYVVKFLVSRVKFVKRNVYLDIFLIFNKSIKKYVEFFLK